MDSPEELERPPIATRMLGRILDHRKHLDYVWITLFAALPLAVSWLIGAHETVDGFKGYWERPNWVALVVLLPVAVLAVRWVMDRVAPVSQAWPLKSLPPIVDLIGTDAGKKQAYGALRRSLLSPWNLIAVLAINTAVHAVDMASLAGFYLADPDAVQISPRDSGPSYLTTRFLGMDIQVAADWSSMFVGETGVGRWESLGLSACAYAVQFSIVFIAILVVALLLIHNLFFLSRIYQRRWVPESKQSEYVHIDLADDDQCFGLRRANQAFNIQLLVMAFAAAFILASRFANVGPGTGLFPSAGQWLGTIGLAAGFVIVSLPIAVKLLPLLPSRSGERAPVSLVGYLREFLTDDAWNEGRDSVEAVAARFAENAFWPTGNNRARPIFFFAFWAFFLVLVPDPRALELLREAEPWSRSVSWGVSGVLALGSTWVLFVVLKGILRYVDPRLVEPPEHPIELSDPVERIQASVFISYRRDDTAAYAGRLRDGLSKRIDPERIFMDITSIEPGVPFVQAIEKAIGSVDLMIVLIGPGWLTIADDDGQPRIEKADDVVGQEVAWGLERQILVIPIRVGGADMPSEEQLPEGIRELAELNAHEMSDTRWDYDLGVLLERLARLPAGDAPVG